MVFCTIVQPSLYQILISSSFLRKKLNRKQNDQSSFKKCLKQRKKNAKLASLVSAIDNKGWIFIICQRHEHSNAGLQVTHYQLDYFNWFSVFLIGFNTEKKNKRIDSNAWFTKLKIEVKNTCAVISWENLSKQYFSKNFDN